MGTLVTWVAAVGLGGLALAMLRRSRPAEAQLGSFVDGSARWRRVRDAVEGGCQAK